MLSLTTCKKKLNKDKLLYSDAETIIIRNVLYKFAQVYHNNLQKDTLSNSVPKKNI